MSTLKAHERVIFEKLFDRGGYVLNFNDRSFAEFFREHSIDINDLKYHKNGASKMKRLRAFWEIEPDPKVGQVLEALIAYACEVEQVAEEDKTKALSTTARFLGKETPTKDSGKSEQDFLRQEFDKLDLSLLDLDSQLQPIIDQRIKEIRKTLEADAALSVIFLCGSTLEALLLDCACKNQEKFNRAEAAPKDREGKVRLFHDWTLENLINVTHEVGMISLDIKKHSHSLKDFRNYIHPRQQAIQNFFPDEHTAEISWRVLQAAIADLSGQRRE